MIYSIYVLKVLHFDIKGLKRPFIVKVTPSIINKDTWHVIIKGKSSKSIKNNYKKLIREIKKQGGKIDFINKVIE